MISASGSNVQGGRTLCHGLALASRSDIINTVLRYFLFLVTEIYNGHRKKKSDNTKRKKDKRSLINPSGFVISDKNPG